MGCFGVQIVATSVFARMTLRRDMVSAPHIIW
jgi:hypothetical protein